MDTKIVTELISLKQGASGNLRQRDFPVFKIARHHIILIQIFRRMAGLPSMFLNPQNLNRPFGAWLSGRALRLPAQK